MSVTIEQLKNVSWYCEDASDTDDMIHCLKGLGIRWRDGSGIEGDSTIYKTIDERYSFLLDSCKLVFNSDTYVESGEVARGGDGQRIPLISWKELSNENRESVSLSEYLFS